MKRNLDGRTFRRSSGGMHVYFHLRKFRYGDIVMQIMLVVLTLEDLRLDMRFLGMVCYLEVEAGYNRLWRWRRQRLSLWL